MHMNEPPIECSDPEAAIVVPEKPVGIDGLSAGHGIQFGLPVDELSHSARHGNEQFSLVPPIQIIELSARHRIVRWRTGPPSPKTQLRTGPEITCAVLKQRQDRSARSTAHCRFVSRRAGQRDNPGCRAILSPHGPDAALPRTGY